jgi:hypothetical protein
VDSATDRMSAELAAELGANNRRLVVDPRTMPLRFSRLKAMGQSPAHCLQAFQDQYDETLATRLGSGAHALLLGKPVAIWDQPAKKGKGKAPRNGEAWETFKTANVGATILNAKEHAKATEIANAIRKNEHARELLFAPGTLVEAPIMWEWGGRKCQSTPDARRKRRLVELKTTRCAEPSRFARDAVYRAYHGQCAFYGLAMEAEEGERPEESFIIAVESIRPYPVTVLRLSDRAIEHGEMLCRAWFERLRTSEATNQWPEYLQEIGTLDIPDPDGFELAFGETDTVQYGDDGSDAAEVV